MPSEKSILRTETHLPCPPSLTGGASDSPLREVRLGAPEGIEPAQEAHGGELIQPLIAVPTEVRGRGTPKELAAD